MYIKDVISRLIQVPGTWLCTICNQTDHVAQQCALAFFHPEPPIGGSGTAGHGRLAGPQLNPASLSPYRREISHNICTSWNRERCTYPGKCKVIT